MDEGPGQIFGRKDGVELERSAAQERRLLDQSDGHVLARQIQGRPQPRDAAADDEGFVDGRDADLLERLQHFGLRHRRADECDGLFGGRLRTVRVGPAGLLANVRRQEQVGVHAAANHGSPERRFVEFRGAGGHDDTIQPEGLDVFDDGLLAFVGTHEHDVAGDAHAVERGRLGGDPIDIDYVGDVAAAMADVDADLLAALGRNGVGGGVRLAAVGPLGLVLRHAAPRDGLRRPRHRQP